MPDPVKLLNTIRKAADFSRTLLGRRGRIVHLVDAAEILAVGDLHGNVANFQRIIKIADLAHQPRRHLVMQELIHGRFTYPDGSDKSHQVVDLWCALKCQFPTRVHFLPGNHELSQWTNRLIVKGDSDLNASFRDGVRSAYGMHGIDVYAAYLNLFPVLPIAIRTPNRVFVSHSLPAASALAALDMTLLERDGHTETDLRPGGLVYSILWGRDTSAANVAAYLEKIDADLLISGHIPCETGFAVPNDRQVILDSLDTPAAYCLFPADRPIAHADLVNCVKLTSM
jgi:hypothetical protein